VIEAGGGEDGEVGRRPDPLRGDLLEPHVRDEVPDE
jgi:hypothetical protein